MSFNNENRKPLLYKVFKDYNILFDEKAGSFGAVRLAQWYGENSEPDPSKAKYEIRKFIIDKTGSEVPNRGVTISSKEAMDDLTDGLVKNNFGNTRNILKSLSNREDFKSTLENINNDPDDSSDGELFDMRDLLMNIEVSEDE